MVKPELDEMPLADRNHSRSMAVYVGRCELGAVRVVVVGGAVVEASIGDDDVAGDDASNNIVAARALAVVAGAGDDADLVVAPAGTAFQRRVWSALRAIPAGSSTTYAALTASLDMALTSIRAVAQAVAKNPIAVIIPCHRVVGSDGALTGFRWGVERKMALLRREGALPASSTQLGLFGSGE